MEGGWDNPARIGLLGNVDGGTPASKVCQHNTEVDSAGECRRTEATDRFGRDLGEIHGRNDCSLADSEASNEAAGIDLSQPSVVGQKDDYTDDPDET